MNDYREDFQSGFRDAKWTFWKVALWVISLLVLFSVVGVVLMPCRAGVGVLKRTLDPDNIIHTYEWFFDVNAEYEATLSRIKTADESVVEFREFNGEPSMWKRDQRSEHSRLSEVLRGLKNHRDSLIQKYNAGSEKANRTIFKDPRGILPERLP
ncbi:MAG: hypothetical protein V3S01_01165 [Dehalococcoidia bacterium]